MSKLLQASDQITYDKISTINFSLNHNRINQVPSECIIRSEATKTAKRRKLIIASTSKRVEKIFSEKFYKAI